MRRSTPFIALVFAALIAAPAAAQTNQEVADQVIALAKAQWAAEMANASPAPDRSLAPRRRLPANSSLTALRRLPCRNSFR